jgi:hypothetical protein
MRQRCDGWLSRRWRHAGVAIESSQCGLAVFRKERNLHSRILPSHEFRSRGLLQEREEATGGGEIKINKH